MGVLRRLFVSNDDGGGGSSGGAQAAGGGVHAGRLPERAPAQQACSGSGAVSRGGGAGGSSGRGGGSSGSGGAGASSNSGRGNGGGGGGSTAGRVAPATALSGLRPRAASLTSANRHLQGGSEAAAAAVTAAAEEQFCVVNRWTMLHVAPQARTEFDAFMLPRRLLVLRGMSAVAVFLGCIEAAFIRVTSAGTAGEAVTTALLLLGGGCGVYAGLATPPAVWRRMGLATAALYAYLMAVEMVELARHTVRLTDHSIADATENSTLLTIRFLVLVLFMLAPFGPAAHCPLLLVGAVEAALTALLIVANIFTIERDSIAQDAGEFRFSER
ncbi:unnamed protein product [Phaeothamnion confervicola]